MSDGVQRCASGKMRREVRGGIKCPDERAGTGTGAKRGARAASEIAKNGITSDRRVVGEDDRPKRYQLREVPAPPESSLVRPMSIKVRMSSTTSTWLISSEVTSRVSRNAVSRSS
jgi:hypothetical protein